MANTGSWSHDGPGVWLTLIVGPVMALVRGQLWQMILRGLEHVADTDRRSRDGSGVWLTLVDDTTMVSVVSYCLIKRETDHANKKKKK